MDGEFIMISGSAGPSCPADKLLIASQFIRSFTGEVLRRGGGLVVLGGNEESTKDEHGVPHVFDWLVLREVESYAESTTENPRPYARIIMSDEAPQRRRRHPERLHRQGRSGRRSTGHASGGHIPAVSPGRLIGWGTALGRRHR